MSFFQFYLCSFFYLCNNRHKHISFVTAPVLRPHRQYWQAWNRMEKKVKKKEPPWKSQENTNDWFTVLAKHTRKESFVVLRFFDTKKFFPFKNSQQQSAILLKKILCSVFLQPFLFWVTLYVPFKSKDILHFFYHIRKSIVAIVIIRTLCYFWTAILLYQNVKTLNLASHQFFTFCIPGSLADVGSMRTLM